MVGQCRHESERECVVVGGSGWEAGGDGEKDGRKNDGQSKSIEDEQEEGEKVGRYSKPF